MKTFQSIDWKGWLIVAWAATFALLYGKMVVEQRGAKVRAAISAPGKSAGPDSVQP